MSQFVGVGFHWFSQKGLFRKRNNDACSVFSSKFHVLAIIGDASERGLRGGEYIEQWMRYVNEFTKYIIFMMF